MGKYQDVDCPICHKPIENGEPVAVCPECGAPYHKHCIEQTKQCVHQDLHALGKNWEPPKKAQANYVKDEPNRCSRCGALNPAQGLFCEVCGNPLRTTQQPNPNDPARDPKNHYHGNAGVNIGPENPAGRGMQTPPPMMEYNPFTTPFGGVNPDEKIDDVPVRDVAIFVGQNTPYFIPKFKQMSDKTGGMFFNFAAMFFHGFYFLYRKMYLWGLLFLIVMFALSTPSLLMYIDTIRKVLDPNAAAWFNSDQLIVLGNTLSMVSVVVRFVCGILANRLYKNYTMQKIKKIQEEYPDHDAYVAALTKQGSISSKLIVVCVIGYFVLVGASSFLLVMFGL